MLENYHATTQKEQSSELTQKYAMRTGFLRLGFIGDELKDGKDILTKRLVGETAFRSGRAAFFEENSLPPPGSIDRHVRS